MKFDVSKIDKLFELDPKRAKVIYLGVVAAMFLSLVLLTLSSIGIFETPAQAARRIVLDIADDPVAAYTAAAPALQESTTVGNFRLFVESYPTIDFATAASFEQAYSDGNSHLLTGKVSDGTSVLPVLIELKRQNGMFTMTYLSINE